MNLQGVAAENVLKHAADHPSAPLGPLLGVPKPAFPCMSSILLSISAPLKSQKLLGYSRKCCFFSSPGVKVPSKRCGSKDMECCAEGHVSHQGGHVVDLDIMAWPNPVTSYAVEIWVNLGILNPQDQDLDGASAFQGSMTTAKASEESKTGMTGRWFQCLGESCRESNWNNVQGWWCFVFLECPLLKSW